MKSSMWRVDVVWDESGDYTRAEVTGFGVVANGISSDPTKALAYALQAIATRLIEQVEHRRAVNRAKAPR